MTLYDTKWNSVAKDSLVVPGVKQLQKKILNNLHSLMEEQDPPPDNRSDLNCLGNQGGCKYDRTKVWPIKIGPKYGQ